MGWFVEEGAYRRTITAPDGEEGWVELRPLNAGDRAEMIDLMSVDAVNGEAKADMRLGQMQLFTVEKALVDWSLPIPISRESVRNLDPAVSDQIFAHASWGSLGPDGEPPLSDSAEPSGAE